MAEEHRLRATIQIYVADEARYREGIADLDALLARLATAEQERDELRQGAFGVALTENGVLRHKLSAAEARVEALQAVIDKAAAEALAATRDGLMPNMTLVRIRDWLIPVARAALACPPQQTGTDDPDGPQHFWPEEER